MTRHAQRLLTGPLREQPDGSLRATWRATCSCGWDAGHDYTKLTRANRAHAIHVAEAQRAA